MEDSDVEKLNEETLYQQYLVAQKKTNTSHVMQYGDLVRKETIQKSPMHIFLSQALGKAHTVGEFQGSATLNKPPRNFIKERYNELLRVRSIEIFVEISRFSFIILA